MPPLFSVLDFKLHRGPRLVGWLPLETWWRIACLCTTFLKILQRDAFQMVLSINLCLRRLESETSTLVCPQLFNLLLSPHSPKQPLCCGTFRTLPLEYVICCARSWWPRLRAKFFSCYRKGNNLLLTLPHWPFPFFLALRNGLTFKTVFVFRGVELLVLSGNELWYSRHEALGELAKACMSKGLIPDWSAKITGLRDESPLSRKRFNVKEQADLFLEWARNGRDFQIKFQWKLHTEDQKRFQEVLLLQSKGGLESKFSVLDRERKVLGTLCFKSEGGEDQKFQIWKTLFRYPPSVVSEKQAKLDLVLASGLEARLRDALCTTQQRRQSPKDWESRREERKIYEILIYFSLLEFGNELSHTEFRERIETRLGITLSPPSQWLFRRAMDYVLHQATL